MSVLVTGGAGYIGSITVRDLLKNKKKVIVIDNLTNGYLDALDKDAVFYKGNVGDKNLLRRIIDENNITSCIHFSAFAYVGESVKEPKKYFQNNVSQTINLLDVLIENEINKFVFSSTCSTYGEPKYLPIDEKHPQNPTNPYGWSKFMVERILSSYDDAYGLKFVALRYFNASGADEELGERHDPETHLIPLILQVAQGKKEYISIYGDDYPTPDGTAIRDYIHVSDLSQAHILALEYLFNGGKSEFFNLGNGDGYSVKQVVETAEKVIGKTIKSKIEPKRDGDPSKLVANSQKARNVLGWKPKYSQLEKIIETAWKWQKDKN